ncbi:MAG: AAA family ATPase [Hyphomicrobiales bacterium]|nr:AAA family ATPase [Hyphomicrobiales bacterium]MCP5374159.1 AAA family ATPase [Hyphomicrobiales bacterium]
MEREPWIWIVCGANGAGKSTLARQLVPEILELDHFVNADEIARGLSPFRPEAAAFGAGRVMIDRIRDLVRRRQSFAVETTLASRRYHHLAAALRETEWHVGVVFIHLRSPALASRRVAIRVRRGGHDVPVEVVARRFHRGVANLPSLVEIADRWLLLDNSGTVPRRIAEGHGDAAKVFDHRTFERIFEMDGDGKTA